MNQSVRGHIHQELTSWIFFRKLAADCSRANIALHGYAMYVDIAFDTNSSLHSFRLWERSAQECLIDMHWLEKYLVTRGGRSKPTNIEANTMEWPDSPVEPLAPCMEAFKVQKKLLDDLGRLCALAMKCEDSSLLDAIQTRFLRKHAKQVKNLGDLLQQTARVSKQPGVGLYLLDQELRCAKGTIPWMVTNDPDVQDVGVERIASMVSEGLVLQGDKALHGGRQLHQQQKM